MTQPAAEQPRRISLDELTSDALDQLYADLQWARDQLLEAQAETTAERTRADRAEQLATDLRTQAITEQKRAEQAEAERDAAQGDRDGWRDRAHGYRAATQRVRAIAQRMQDWDSNIPSTTRWVTELRAALDEQQEQP